MCMSADEKVDAWMPLWIGAYLADTMTLTTQQHGAYLLLLFAYWRNRGPLADDDEDLASIVKASADEWPRLRAKLERFFVIEAGAWRHKRADDELKKAQDGRAKASDKASKAASAKWAKQRKQCSSDAPSIAPAVPEQCPTPSPIKDTPIPPRGAKAAVSLKTWAESVKAKGEKLIPEDDAVFDYAAAAGIPDDFMALAWQEFRHRYSQPDAKRYRDWRQVFRKSVRSNWFKLWYADQHGEFRLTTAGIQAQRALAEAA
jgi:uncharacterized protein YdaU (DUF1376 family)